MARVATSGTEWCRRVARILVLSILPLFGAVPPWRGCRRYSFRAASPHSNAKRRISDVPGSFMSARPPVPPARPWPRAGRPRRTAGTAGWSSATSDRALPARLEGSPLTAARRWPWCAGGCGGLVDACRFEDLAHQPRHVLGENAGRRCVSRASSSASSRCWSRICAGNGWTSTRWWPRMPRPSGRSPPSRRCGRAWCQPSRNSLAEPFSRHVIP
jgi:hypothetical protein